VPVQDNPNSRRELSQLEQIDWQVADWVLDGLQAATKDVEFTGLKPWGDISWEATVELKNSVKFTSVGRRPSQAALKVAHAVSVYLSIDYDPEATDGGDLEA
jgi:hypothetical protein